MAGRGAKAVAIYGAGGHGVVVLDALEQAGRAVVGFLDDDPGRQRSEYCGYPVLSPSGLEELGRVEVVVAIGDPNDRERLTVGVREAGYGLATVLHPSATVGRDANIAPGAMVLAQAAVNPRARIGLCVIVNTGAVVDHDCVVADYAHIGPGVRLAGDVRIGAGTLVGTGATVAPEVEIGPGALVGAGAAVVADVPPGETVVGVPAKPLVRDES